MSPKSILTCLAAVGFALASPMASLGAGTTSNGCVSVGSWVDPSSGERWHDVMSALSSRDVVLLGETHDEAEHHRWQLHTLAVLHDRRPDLVIGFEMFPRQAQPVLDRWVAGELDEKGFLQEVGWEEVWKFDADLYLPLFHFARMHRVKMLALNVERTKIRRIAEEGLTSLPQTERHGIGEPAPPSAAYLERLFEAFESHWNGNNVPAKDSEEFKRFVEAQLFWDRAMAEAIAAARHGDDKPLVVGIMGQGHVEYGHGVAHQLSALGVTNVAAALPWDVSADCGKLAAGIADAVFGIAPPKTGNAEAARDSSARD